MPIFEDILDHVLLSLGLEVITVRVLREDQVDYSDPVLVQGLFADFVGTDIVCTESLHAEVVNESMLLQAFDVYNQFVTYLDSLLWAICSLVISLGMNLRATENLLPLS